MRYLSYKPHGCAPQKERVVRLNRSIHPEGVFGWDPKASMLFCPKKTENKANQFHVEFLENTRSNKMLSNHHFFVKRSQFLEHFRPLKRNLSYEWSHVQIYVYIYIYIIVLVYSAKFGWSTISVPWRPPMVNVQSFVGSKPAVILPPDGRWSQRQGVMAVRTARCEPISQNWFKHFLNDSDLNFQPIKLYVKCWHIFKSQHPQHDWMWSP